MRVLSVAAALCPLVTLPALACPTVDDLQTGVRMVFPDGTTEIVRRDLGALETVLEVIEEGVAVQRDRLIHGAYLAYSADLVDGQERDPLIVKYAQRPPYPAAGLIFEVDVVEIYGGETPVQERYVWSETMNVQIGECRYDAFDGTLTRRVDGALDGIEVVRFLPAVGTMYVRAVGDTLADLRPDDLARIEAVQ